MKTVLRKMLFVDLIKGLKVTFRNQDPKEAITEQYPLQRVLLGDGFLRVLIAKGDLQAFNQVHEQHFA